jgi:DNA-3-methyladenine glycosylase
MRHPERSEGSQRGQHHDAASRFSATTLERLRPPPRSFYVRDPVTVARALLGKLVVRKFGRSVMAGRIVEDEAYLGAADAAAHSARGRTERNAVLFGPPGHAYVYFIYGAHYCLNVSCMPPGDAGCVLIRALEPVTGMAAMARNRGLDATAPGVFKQMLSKKLMEPRPVRSASVSALRALTSGPGRLCEALAITRPRDNGADVTDAESALWIADDGFAPDRIVATPRVGITKAAAAELRFLIGGNAFVSGPRVAG